MSSEEELTSSGGEESIDISFGEQFLNLLNEKIPEGICPILSLSKIPKLISKQKKEEVSKQKETTKLTETKKKLLNQKHVEISEYSIENESKLRKLTTKGVISLFSSISKTQNKKPIVDPLEEEENKPKQTDDFLNMLTKAAIKH